MRSGTLMTADNPGLTNDGGANVIECEAWVIDSAVRQYVSWSVEIWLRCW